MKVDFETPAPGTEVTLGWCPDPIYDGTITIGGVTVPKLVGISAPLTHGDLDDADGTQFACVGVQQARVVDEARTPFGSSSRSTSSATSS